MAVGMLTEDHLQENATTCRAGRQFALVSLDPALLHVMISPPEVLCRSWMDHLKIRANTEWMAGLYGILRSCGHRAMAAARYGRKPVVSASGRVLRR